jgi:hypothetical protein
MYKLHSVYHQLTTLQKSDKKGKSPKKPIKETFAHYEDFNDFTKWYKALVAVYGGYEPKNQEVWFDLVQDSHVELRRKIDGVQSIIKHDIKEFQKPLSPQVYGRFTTALDKILPGFFGYPGENARSDFATPYNFKGIKHSKIVTRYIELYCQFNNTIKKDVDKILEQLGQKWANGKTQSMTLYSRLDTTARGFAQIGHYGVDRDSCFKQNGCHNHDKYNLGGLDNTFVLLLSECGNFDNIDNICGRMWGFYKPRNKTVNFCNLYVDKGFSRGNAVEVCRQHSARILGVEENELTMVEDLIEIKSPVYHNTNSQNWTFYIGDKILTTQTL